MTPVVSEQAIAPPAGFGCARFEPRVQHPVQQKAQARFAQHRPQRERVRRVVWPRLALQPCGLKPDRSCVEDSIRAWFYFDG